MSERLLTFEECLAWADRYESTPWNMLALTVAVDRQPSPMLVMRSLFHIAAQAQRKDAA